MSNLDGDINATTEGGGGGGRGTKRKKKKSFLQNARKYGRQGAYGRGSHLDADTYQYMVRVLELMRDGFPSFEEKQVFVNNVYDQTLGSEVDYARNQIGSRVLDSLMNHANFDVIERLANAFMGDLRPMCSDRFASHVLQRIIRVSAERGTRSLNVVGDSKAKGSEVVDVKDTEIKSYNEWTLKLCKYLMNNTEDFVRDTYANHIMRTVLEVLSGLIADPQDASGNKSKRKLPPDLTARTKVPQEYTDLLVEFCRRLSSLPQFSEFGRDELTSGLLQVLLYSLKDVDDKLNKIIVKNIIAKCFTYNEETQATNVFDAESSMRLLEACLAVAGPKVYTQIYAKFFCSRLGKLSLMVGANFTVQRLFDYCKVKEELEQMFDEIATHFEAILERKHTGVLASLADSCKRLQTRQGPFVNAISKALHCDQPVDRQNLVAMLVARMTPYERLEQGENNEDFRINLHGSLIVQSMLNFNKPIKIVNSLLATNNRDLKILFADPRGSRVMDAFAESKFIGEKSREKLVKRLQGCWVHLACSKHGSRSLERVWQWSHVNQRLLIVEELASVGAILQSTEHGKIISNKLNVPLFNRSKKDWIESLGKEERTKTMFADIIKNVTD